MPPLPTTSLRRRGSANSHARRRPLRLRVDASIRLSFTAKRAARVLAPKSNAASSSAPTFSSSGYYDAYYLRAQKVRTLIRQDFLNAFEQVDAIVTPTTPTARSRSVEKFRRSAANYLSDVFTVRCPRHLRHQRPVRLTSAGEMLLARLESLRAGRKS